MRRAFSNPTWRSSLPWPQA